MALQGSFCQTPMEQAALAFLPSAKTADDVRETVTGGLCQHAAASLCSHQLCCFIVMVNASMLGMRPLSYQL